MRRNSVHLRVWGDWACFTRPEMKVERVSYPVMTPSAARGVLEAVFWKPQMQYLIDAIRVVKRGSWASVRRNEVRGTISMKKVGEWMKDPSEWKPIQADDTSKSGQRAQRNMLALRDVEYIVSAEARLTGLGSNSGNSLGKYVEEFRRRAEKGKCFHRPALGMREFAADFEWVEDPQAALEKRAEEIGSRWDRSEEDLGLMLYDVFSPRDRAAGFRWKSSEEMGSRRGGSRYAGEQAQPRACFFRARLKDSTMACHPDEIEIIEPRGE